MPQGWTVVPETTSAHGWTPVEESASKTEQPKEPSEFDKRLTASRARIKQQSTPESKGREPILQAAVGALKGAGSTAVGLGRMVHKIPGVDAVLGKIPDDASTTLGLDPANTAQSIGKGAEQLAEFFVPGGAAKSMGLLGKVATEAFGTYAVAQAQGSPHPAVSAAMAAVLAPLSALAPKAAPGLKASANKSMASALGKGVEITEEKVHNAIAESVPRAFDLGLHPTWRGLLSKAKGVQKEAGKAVEDTLASRAGDTPVPIQPVVDALTALTSKAQNIVPVGKAGNLIGAGPGAPKTQIAVFNSRLVKKIDELKGILSEQGPTVTARQLHNIKKDWSDFVWKGAQFAKPKLTLEARAKDVAVDAMVRVLKQDAPKISDVDREYHLARQTYDVIADAAGMGRLSSPALALKQGAVKASKAALIGSAVGGVASSAAGLTHTVGLVAGSAVGVVLEQAMKSPGWRLLPATAKNTIARALADGDAETVRRIVSPLIAKSSASKSAP